MKIGYLLYNERPNSGLMNTQVLGLLKELSKNDNLKITLIAIWQPWVYIKYSKEIEELKIDLKENNIDLKSIPFGLPSRHFFTNKLLLQINIIYIYMLLKIYNLNKFDIVHCRGYFISYISSLLKKDYKLIFDMRSLFPEENISSENWTEKDLIYAKWKKIEKFIIDKSEVSIGVSLPMVEIISKEYATTKVKYIPIGFNTDKFTKNAIQRDLIRKELKIQDKMVFVYAGSLELGFWNDIRVYTKYFNYINSTVTNAYFLILTGSNHEVIIEYLSNNQINNYTLMSVDSDSVSDYLNAGDVGIQVMNKLTDSRTRFGVKTIEYWASGLPVITNSNVGGICSLLVDNNYLGVIINNQDNVYSIKNLSDKNIYDNNIIRKYALSNFTFQEISKKYLEIYKSI